MHRGADPRTALQTAGIVGSYAIMKQKLSDGHELSIDDGQNIYISTAFITTMGNAHLLPDNERAILENAFTSFREGHENSAYKFARAIDSVLGDYLRIDDAMPKIMQSISNLGPWGHQLNDYLKWIREDIVLKAERTTAEQKLSLGLEDNPLSRSELDSNGLAEGEKTNIDQNPNEYTESEGRDKMTLEEVAAPPLYRGDALIDPSPETIVGDHLQKWDETVSALESPTAEEIQDEVLMRDGSFLQDGVVYGYEWAMESYTDDFGVNLDTPGLEPDSGVAEDMPSNVEPNPNESTGGEDSDAIRTEEVNPPPLYGGDPLIDPSAETVVVDYLENWDTWGLGKAEITLPNGWSVADAGSNRFGTQLIAWDETVYVFEIPTAEEIQDGVLMGNGTFFRDGVVYAHEWAMESYTDDFGVRLDPPGDTLIGGSMNLQLNNKMLEILAPTGTEISI